MPCPCNVYFAGLPPSFGEKALRRICEPCGHVLSVKIMLDANTGLSRGFGFALFEDRQAATRVVETLNGVELEDGFRARVELSAHEAKHILHRSNRILIRNVPEQVASTEVREYFERFGTITALSCRRDQQTNRYMVTITYTNEESARAAVANAHGKKVFEMCPIPLLVKISEPLGARKARAVEARRELAQSGTSKRNALSASLSMSSAGSSERMDESLGLEMSSNTNYADHEFAHETLTFTHSPAPVSIYRFDPYSCKSSRAFLNVDTIALH